MAIARAIDRRIYFVLDRAHARISKTADARLQKSAGLGTAQAAALIYLGYHNNCLLGELAEGVGHNNSAITGLVDRMEKTGLVLRAPSHIDRRSKTVELTDAGWKTRQTVIDSMRDFNDVMIRGFSESEIATLMKFITLAPENLKSLED